MKKRSRSIKRHLKHMKTTNEELFRSITVEMDSLYRQKNADYGNSYAELYARYGSIYPLIRLEEKIARVERLTTSEKDPEVKSESLRDTLLDLANYSVMWIAELDKDRLREGVFSKQYTEETR